MQVLKTKNYMKLIDFTLLIFVTLLINSDEILIFSLTTNLIICAFTRKINN